MLWLLKKVVKDIIWKRGKWLVEERSFRGHICWDGPEENCGERSRIRSVVVAINIILVGKIEKEREVGGWSVIHWIIMIITTISPISGFQCDTQTHLDWYKNHKLYRKRTKVNKKYKTYFRRLFGENHYFVIITKPTWDTNWQSIFLNTFLHPLSIWSPVQHVSIKSRCLTPTTKSTNTF